MESLRLKNIQSWKDATIDLDIGLNVIDADNETGKSVIMKAFRKICFYNFFGRGSNEVLIRRGTECGECFIRMIYLDDGVLIDRKVVKLEIYKTYQIYKLYNVVDEKLELIQSWKQDYPPVEVLNALGWFIDEDNQILLNLIDLEQPLPLISSNRKFNAKILKFVTESAELETCKENLTVHVNRLKELYNIEKTNYNRLNSMRSTIDVKDTFKLQRSIEDREVLSDKINVLQDLYENMLDLTDSVLHRNISFKFIDEDLLESKFKVADKLCELKNNLIQLKEINSFIVEDKYTDEIADSIESKLGLVDKLNLTKLNVITLLNTREELKRTQKKIDEINLDIRTFEEENKVCPWCGNTFQVGGNTFQVGGNTFQSEEGCEHER